MAGRRPSPYRAEYPQSAYRDEVWNVFNGAPPDFAGGPPGPPVGLPPFNPYGKDRASEPATEDVNPIVDAQAFADVQRQVRAVERRLADVSLQARGVAEREVSERIVAFESTEKRFKQWVAREYDALQQQFGQLRTTLLDAQQQQGKVTGRLTAVTDAMDLRVAGIESHVSQVSERVDRDLRRNAVDRTSSPPRHAQQRVRSPPHRAPEWGAALADVNEKLARVAQQQADAADTRAVMLDSRLRDLMNEMRIESEQRIKAVVADAVAELPAPERIDSSANEARLAAQIAQVSERAQGSIKELWEEQNRLTTDWAQTVDSIRGVMESQGGLAKELWANANRSQIQEEERHRHELRASFESLQARLVEAEAELENSRRSTEHVQRQVEGKMDRMGKAIELAQAQWISDSSRLEQAVESASNQFARSEKGTPLDVDPLRRRVEDCEHLQQLLGSQVRSLENTIAEHKKEVNSLQLDADARAETAAKDLQASLSKQLGQVDFDLRAMARTAVEEVEAQLAAELPKSELLVRNAQKAGEARLAATTGALEEKISDVRRYSEDLAAAVEKRQRDGLALTVASVEQKLGDKTAAVALRATELEKRAVGLRERVDEQAAALGRRLADHKEQTSQSVNDLLRQSVDFQETTADTLRRTREELDTELKRGHESLGSELRGELEQAVASEASARVAMDQERLESMQRRLSAHEQLVQSRVKDVDARVAMALQSSAQTLETELSTRARLIGDRMGLLEDSTREQLTTLSTTLTTNHASTLAKIEERRRERDAECSKLQSTIDKNATIFEDKIAEGEVRDKRHAAEFAESLRELAIAQDARIDAAKQAALDATAKGDAELHKRLDAIITDRVVALEERADAGDETDERLDAAREEAEKRLDAADQALEETKEAFSTQYEELKGEMQEAAAAIQEANEAREQGDAALEAKVDEAREIVDQNAQSVADLTSKAEAHDERFEEAERALGAVDEKVVSAVVSGCEEVLTRAEADRAVRVAQDRAADTKVNEFLAQLKHQIDDVAGMRQLLEETIDRVEKEEQETKARIEGLETGQQDIKQRSEEIEKVQGLLDKTQGDLL